MAKKSKKTYEPQIVEAPVTEVVEAPKVIETPKIAEITTTEVAETPKKQGAKRFEFKQSFIRR